MPVPDNSTVVWAMQPDEEMVPFPKSTQERMTRLDWGPDRWYACHHPEKPMDETSCYHDCCTPCMIAAQAENLNIVPKMQRRLEEHGEAPDE